MKRWLALLVMAFGAQALAQGGRGQKPPSGPELLADVSIVQFELPADMYLGEVAGVALNSKHHFFVFTRTGNDGPARGAQAARLWEFDAAGKFVREIGKNLYGFSFAHVVRIDKDDNIWCVDEGANMVIEFNPAGRVMEVFGRKLEALELERIRNSEFNRPTDVAWDAAGNVFVADGYNNSRVVKFDKVGNWIKEWGKRGTAPGEFNIPHAIVADAAGRLYVGDRENHRVQVFDADGTFVTQFSDVGGMALCITPGPNQVLFASDGNRLQKLDLTGKVLGVFSKPGRAGDHLSNVHELTCVSDHELYAAELATWRVQKINVHR